MFRYKQVFISHGVHQNLMLTLNYFYVQPYLMVRKKKEVLICFYEQPYWMVRKKKEVLSSLLSS
jgi:hypothetical protein